MSGKYQIMLAGMTTGFIKMFFTLSQIYKPTDDEKFGCFVTHGVNTALV